jgi:hypothetical protein
MNDLTFFTNEPDRDLHNSMKGLTVLNVQQEINTTHHKQIDQIVFEHFSLTNGQQEKS